jgi:hypothetical protein
VTLAEIEGRAARGLDLGAEGVVSLFGFMPDEIEGIAAYRVVQEAPGLIRILVVAEDSLDPAALERARVEYQSRLGRKARIVFETVTALPPAP